MSQFASLRFDTADQRRALGRRFAQHVPADVANQLTWLTRGVPEREVADPRTRTVGPHEYVVLPRLRVLVPFLGPNVVRMGRLIGHGFDHGEVTAGPDGVFEVPWETLGGHSYAHAQSLEATMADHDLVDELAAGGVTTDSWHDPMLVVPVRHTYADGTATRTELMVVEGNARAWGARMALAVDLVEAGVGSPWAAPDQLPEPTGLAGVRSLVAAMRARETGPDKSTRRAASDGSLEDWADLMLAAPGMDVSDLNSILFVMHHG